MVVGRRDLENQSKFVMKESVVKLSASHAVTSDKERKGEGSEHRGAEQMRGEEEGSDFVTVHLVSFSRVSSAGQLLFNQCFNFPCPAAEEEEEDSEA
jgi:hypothetical protein